MPCFIGIGGHGGFGHRHWRARAVRASALACTGGSGIGGFAADPHLRCGAAGGRIGHEVVIRRVLLPSEDTRSTPRSPASIDAGPRRSRGCSNRRWRTQVVRAARCRTAVHRTSRHPAAAYGATRRISRRNDPRRRGQRSSCNLPTCNTKTNLTGQIPGAHTAEQGTKPAIPRPGHPSSCRPLTASLLASCSARCCS